MSNRREGNRRGGKAGRAGSAGKAGRAGREEAGSFLMSTWLRVLVYVFVSSVYVGTVSENLLPGYCFAAQGDILVFLTGQDEIENLESILRDAAKRFVLAQEMGREGKMDVGRGRG